MERGWVTIKQAARAIKVENHFVRMWVRENRFLVRKVEEGEYTRWEINQTDFTIWARTNGYRARW